MTSMCKREREKEIERERRERDLDGIQYVAIVLFFSCVKNMKKITSILNIHDFHV